MTLGIGADNITTVVVIFTDHKSNLYYSSKRIIHVNGHVKGHVSDVPAHLMYNLSMRNTPLKPSLIVTDY